MKIHTHKLSLAAAIFSALAMLLLSLANSMGIYQNAVQQMQNWHMFYKPDFAGTITGMIEAAVMTYVSVYIIVWIYNALLGKKK
ncbi:MAG: hypothetical protein ABII13_01075 [Patescibacteria group bacterium]|nr:hypothetical protein [Patescibacteria group bacterium]MBU2509391.1 hypothetical protein [Patescibacteria group bacterium]